MDIPFIQKLIELHERSGMVELEYAQSDQRLRLSKLPSVDASASTLPLIRPAGLQTGHAAPLATPAQELSAPHKRVLKAALSGIFHRRPGPAEAPYVNEGDQVQEGHVVGVVEAMKVFNGVESEWAGRIIAILAEDGASVEPGTPLFHIEPTAANHV